MKAKLYLALVAMLLAALLLPACATPTETAAPPSLEEAAIAEDVVEEPAEELAEPAVALKITGLVDNEMGWTEDEVKAMESMDVESTDKDGKTETYTGVSLNSLLELAGVKAGVTGLVFVADDGTTAEVTLEEIQACTDCIVSFRSKGGFSIVLPGFSSKVQVKGVVEIQVK